MGYSLEKKNRNIYTLGTVLAVEKLSFPISVVNRSSVLKWESKSQINTEVSFMTAEWYKHIFHFCNPLFGVWIVHLDYLMRGWVYVLWFTLNTISRGS